MGTRLATAADIGSMVNFLYEYHTTSPLADVAFDRYSMIKCVEYYIGMPKHIALIYEKDKEVKGVLLGSIEPFMFNEKRHWATDLLNVAEEGGAWLTKRFLEWSKMHGVDRVFMGVSTGDGRSDRLYQSLGMEQVGGMHMLKKSEAEK